MKFTAISAAFAAALTIAISTPALAGNPEGKIQVKLLGTAVLPDGKITKVNINAVGVPATSQSRATDSFIPTVAAEFFLSPNISLETICCVTPHDVRGAGALAGAKLVDNAIILPATVTAKYHLGTGGGLKPYLGAGVTRFFIFGENVGKDAAALGATSVNLSDQFGFVLQGGFDAKLNDRGLGLSVDAKRYFVGTTATFKAGAATALQTKHDLDPWVLSAGLTYRF